MPELGRWLNRDPLGEQGGLNLYGFVNNNSIDLFDLLGLKMIQGIDITDSFCGCQERLLKSVKWSEKMQVEYKTCGTNGNCQDGDDIENCIADSIKSQGIKVKTAGTTDSSGNVVVKQVSGKCGPLLMKSTEIHEQQHSGHTKDLLEKYGIYDQATKKYIESEAFYKIWDSADDWWKDEHKAYGAVLPFLNEVLEELDKICCGKEN